MDSSNPNPSWPKLDAGGVVAISGNLDDGGACFKAVMDYNLTGIGLRYIVEHCVVPGQTWPEGGPAPDLEQYYKETQSPQ